MQCLDRAAANGSPMKLRDYCRNANWKLRIITRFA